MGKVVYVENYCEECGETTILEHSIYECPICHAGKIYVSRFVKCDCGKEVQLYDFISECYECGKLYNAFGQELAPVEDWDQEERYETFGPEEDVE